MSPDERVAELEAFLNKSRVNLAKQGPTRNRFVKMVMNRVRDIIDPPVVAKPPEPVIEKPDPDAGRIIRFEPIAPFAKGPAVVMTQAMSAAADEQNGRGKQ